MASDITVYEKPTCTKCRELAKFLTERGIDFERVNFHIDPLSAAEITQLLAKANLRPRDVLRTSEPSYKVLGLAKADLSDGELIDIIAEHYELLQRPIVVRGERAVLARPTENVLALLD
jgi:arsenate reductase